ncbi:MAG: ribosome small subunit-dependent GTPase A [Clostridiales bacterium]|nr:ribosome small subunit-dependent GTPase A [Clostridiales bacterium]
MGKGKIVKGIGGFYYVDSGSNIFECKARGIFRKKKIIPMVGDDVVFSVLDEGKKLGIIDEILERKTELFRPSVANVDQAIVVFSVMKPNPNYYLLDHFLVLAENEDLEIVICINKIDLASNREYEEIVDVYKNTGNKIILSSITDGAGINDLRDVLKDKTSVFAGPSGVGKSSLLNEIAPNFKLETGEISRKTSRGKHITRHVELLKVISTGWVVDTPGFSSLSLEFIKEEQKLAYHFPEFLDYIPSCKFVSCIHINEPECAVKDAIKEGKVHPQRYKNYVRMLEEIKENRRY